MPMALIILHEIGYSSFLEKKKSRNIPANRSTCDPDFTFPYRILHYKEYVVKVENLLALFC